MGDQCEPSLSLCSKCGKHARILSLKVAFKPEFYSKSFGQFLIQRYYEHGAFSDLEEFLLEMSLSSLPLPDENVDVEGEIIDAVNFWNTASEDLFSWDDMQRYECVLDFREACRSPKPITVDVPFFWNEALVNIEEDNMVWFLPSPNPDLN